ncbi:four-carbon acid sugar kinase family protein [Arthrobacter antibioticus]|uniref:four-carbon acid sugar kinase family protein n=1 Tax=Arthrobacter sp. H35-MC1 TaxID=3046203 RepID=UPI0024BA258E|nr:four-carbon acid sugar kinase family protein [Arthrobacter sp. H35-MC1]MDJ0317335.1 four-carbon acid sugar kinase family protein [Arthrobacter sp. H35-MC1]
MVLESDLLSHFPSEVPVTAATVAQKVIESGRVLVVLDDDPTGTQSVSNLPVLTHWDIADFRWAYAHLIDGHRANAIYILTNTRSLDPSEAAARNAQIVRNALKAATEAGVTLGFVSRSDSTLRGHYPLEPDTIAATLLAEGAGQVDGVVMVPAFPDAGRITIGGVHYTRADAGSLIPVGDTEFAKDATFGFTSSRLDAYVEEKSQGRFGAANVIPVDLSLLRTGTPAQAAMAIADAIEAAQDSCPIVVDAVSENDLRVLALGLDEAERRGKHLIYRVGPPFVRARIGQEIRAELNPSEIYSSPAPATQSAGGLIVVGSHVGVTTRQLKALTQQHSAAHIIEIDVEKLLKADGGTHLDDVVEQVGAALASGDVIVHTSRLLIKTDEAAASLKIARTVSAAVVEVVNRTLKATPPRFVIAKGGITSSDVAAHGLEIRHAIVRGPMLPGIVSLWEPVDGPAAGIPYIVFAGNVGNDQSLADVTRKLSSTF